MIEDVLKEMKYKSILMSIEFHYNNFDFATAELYEKMLDENGNREKMEKK